MCQHEDTVSTLKEGETSDAILGASKYRLVFPCVTMDQSRLTSIGITDIALQQILSNLTNLIRITYMYLPIPVLTVLPPELPVPVDREITPYLNSLCTCLSHAISSLQSNKIDKQGSCDEAKTDPSGRGRFIFPKLENQQEKQDAKTSKKRVHIEDWSTVNELHMRRKYSGMQYWISKEEEDTHRRVDYQINIYDCTINRLNS